MSLAFLNLKGWHPSNKANQKLIWIAEQEAKKRIDDEAYAEAQIEKNAEMERYKDIAASKGDTRTLNKLNEETMSFMYQKPPGMETKESKIHLDEEYSNNEDAAVVAFRNKVSQATASKDMTLANAAAGIRSTIITGSSVDKKIQSRDERARLSEEPSNLEKYVGRRAFESTTLSEQVERFPALKNAPVEGSYANSVKVVFKPLGKTIRNTRCARCQIWGHQSGDRECPMINDNPNDASRREREDPMSSASSSKKRKSVMSNDGKAYELIESSENDEDDRERQFLASLSTKEKKKLLKKLKKEEKKQSKSHDKKRKDKSRKKKHKK